MSQDYVDHCAQLLSGVCKTVALGDCDRCTIHTAMLEMLQHRTNVVLDHTPSFVDDIVRLMGIEDDTLSQQCPVRDSHTASYFCAHADNPKVPMAIYIITNRSKIGMAHLKSLYHFLRNVTHDSPVPPVHLVTKFRMSSFAQQSMRSLLHIRNMWNNIEVTCILWAEVLHNPLRHCMVPPHRLVTKAYVRQQLPFVYDVVERQMPKISKTDPVVRYLGLRVGQFVAIQRSEHEEAYRVVV